MCSVLQEARLYVGDHPLWPVFEFITYCYVSNKFRTYLFLDYANGLGGVVLKQSEPPSLDAYSVRQETFTLSVIKFHKMFLNILNYSKYIQYRCLLSVERVSNYYDMGCTVLGIIHLIQ